MSALERDQTTV